MEARVTVYRYPPEICAEFAGGEEAKRAARLDAVKWMNGLALKPGDKVWIPHPQTGELMEFRKDKGGIPVQ